MSGDLAGEITAIATAVLAGFAIITAVFAILAYLKQSGEVRDQGQMLNLQRAELDEQRKINAEQTRVLGLQAKELGESLAERKRAQVSHVFMWTEGESTDPHATPSESASDTLRAHIKNTSKQPIYSVHIDWNREGTRFQYPDSLFVLMPDSEKTGIRRLPPHDQIAARKDVIVLFDSKKWPVAGFRDAAGRWWRLRPDGQLDEDLDRRWIEKAMFDEWGPDEDQPDEQPATGQPDDGTP
jgi:hypothetical protein